MLYLFILVTLFTKIILKGRQNKSNKCAKEIPGKDEYIANVGDNAKKNDVKPVETFFIN